MSEGSKIAPLLELAIYTWRPVLGRGIRVGLMDVSKTRSLMSMGVEMSERYAVAMRLHADRDAVQVGTLLCRMRSQVKHLRFSAGVATLEWQTFAVV